MTESVARKIVEDNHKGESVLFVKEYDDVFMYLVRKQSDVGKTIGGGGYTCINKETGEEHHESFVDYMMREHDE